MDLTKLLSLLPIVGPAMARVGEFTSWFHQAAAVLHPKDQATAKAALADIQADNDEGHRRLQEKLQQAARR